MHNPRNWGRFTGALRPPRRTHRGPFTLAAVGLLTAAATTACSVSTGGSGGVELGSDWKGASSFALSKVNGQLTVVGVNPRKAKAEPLAVVPSKKDDNDTLAPQIEQLADGQWVITVPRNGGKPDRLYRLNRSDHAVSPEGPGVEAMHGLFPAKSLVAAVPGLPDDGKTDGKNKREDSRVLAQHPGKWTTGHTAKLPGPVSLAASSPSSDTLCVVQDPEDSGGRVQTTGVDLSTGDTHLGPKAPAGFEVQQLACDGGDPVLAGPGKSTSGKTSSGSGKISVAHKDDSTLVTADGARVDQLAVHNGEITAAVFHRDRESLVTVDAKSGKETHRVNVSGLTDVDGMQRTGSGWLLFSDDGAALVKPESESAQKVSLPGTLLAS